MPVVPKFIRTQLFRHWRLIGAVNLVFWPIVGGLTLMKLILPKDDTRPVSNIESERIRKMLEDVYTKSAQQKIDDALKALGLFMDPANASANSSPAARPSNVAPTSGINEKV